MNRTCPVASLAFVAMPASRATRAIVPASVTDLYEPWRPIATAVTRSRVRMRADMRGSSSAAARSTNVLPICTCAPACIPAVRSRPIIRARTSSSPAMLTSPIVREVMLQTFAPDDP